MSVLEPTILKLPAGTIVSSPVSNEILMSGVIERGSCTAPGPHDRDLEDLGKKGSQRATLSIENALRSAPAKDVTPRDSRCQSCIELHSYSLKLPSRRPLDLPVSERRIFFPSTSTSQLSKTPDQIDGFADMLVDFAVKQTHNSNDVAALDARIALHTETKVSDISTPSRPTMTRPPPLDLGPTSNFVESQGTGYGSNLSGRVSPSSPNNQGSQPLKQPSTKEAESDAGTPYIIRPRTNYDVNASTRMSPLTPLILLKPSHSNGSEFLRQGRRNAPFRFLNNFLQRSKQTDEIYRQVDDSMLDYR